MGEWAEFSHEKLLGFKRLLGLVQLTGWNRPGFSLLDFISQRLIDYGSSYMFIGLGGISTLGLSIWARHLRPARLLISWGLTLYPIFAFIALAGSGNDQFFYFLLVPAIVLVGYSLVTISEIKKVRLPFHRVNQFIGRLSVNAEKFAPLTLLLLVLPYGAIQWWTKYGTGDDNGYAQFTRFVQANLPPQAPLNASGDPIKFHYFFPSRPILDAATPAEAIQAGVHYFALTPKDIRYRYGETSPELARWIEQQGKLLKAFNGDSYGDIYLYSIDFQDKPGSVVSAQQPEDRHWRSYQPARAGFVGPLIISLFVWCLLSGILVLILFQLHRFRLPDSPDLHKLLAFMKFSPISLIKSWFI
jgi:hypothetical protein